MQSMIEIDDKIISTEILTEEFCCPLDECKGECCVEGNAGAPLEIEEVDILEEEWENYKPYMIEINTIPGMSAGSIVPKQIRAAGMTMGEVLTLVIEDALCNQ